MLTDLKSLAEVTWIMMNDYCLRFSETLYIGLDYVTLLLWLDIRPELDPPLKSFLLFVGSLQSALSTGYWQLGPKRKNRIGLLLPSPGNLG